MAKPASVELKTDIEFKTGHNIAASTFTFKCGVTVKIERIANRVALNHFVAQVSAVRKGEPGDKDLAERFFLFLAAWGVSTNPPPDAIEELELVFGPSDSLRVKRARWVRFLLMGTLDESSDFIAAHYLTNFSTPEQKEALIQTE